MSIEFQNIANQTLIVPTDDDLAERAAEYIVSTFSQILSVKEKAVFIPSSGRTPIKTYAKLKDKYKMALDWQRVTLVQMDEYWENTLDPNAYFSRFIQKYLVEPLGIGEFISMKTGSDLSPISPKDYDRRISQLGDIDFALHGIGRNGHIGFNEPELDNSVFETRLVKLAQETREDNFTNSSETKIPHYGITLGLRTLLSVRNTLLIANGKHKAEAIQKLYNKSPISETPACALWDCDRFGIIVNHEAAQLIPHH